MALFLAVLSICVLFITAEQEFSAYRCIQIDKGAAKSQLGCRRTTVNAAAALFESAGSGPTRQVLVARLAEQTEESLEALIKRSSVGVLLLLPSDLAGSVSVEMTQSMAWLESKMVNEKIPIAVYFAIEDEPLTEFYEKLKGLKSGLSSGVQYTILVNDKEATPIQTVDVTSLQGFLEGSAEGGEGGTFALVAHYDTLGAIPGFTRGADLTGTSVTSVLELARIFSKIYSDDTTRPDPTVAFLLSGAGRLNYYGTRQWLQQNPKNVLNDLDFALCLEAIGGENLYLHISRRPKDASIRALYEIFNATAARFGIPFQIVQKKINVTHTEMAWEHEAFAYRKVLAATLSSRPAPTPQLLRSSALDVTVNHTILKRNIRFIGEVLIQHMYGHKASDVPVLQGSHAISTRHVSTWMNYLGSHPRATPIPSQNAPVIDALEQEFNRYLQDVQTSKYSSKVEDLRMDYTLYDAMEVTMSIYNSKSAMFDVMLFIPIAVYCLSIHVYFKGFAEIKSMVLGTSSKKKK